jgi:8-oxo-dGTP pyrophosphatase MutT (NUDIX family)
MPSVPPSPTADRHRSQRPRDAATLIIVRRDAAHPRVLMGRRPMTAAFMPGKYVFPGGRVEPADHRVLPAGPLPPDVEALLARRLRRKVSSPGRALAMAAVRETFEEVGFIVGQRTPQPAATRAPAWAAFLATGHAPDLSALRLFMRAITPPGRTRRFDTRFFLTEAEAVANLDRPVAAATEELLEPVWVTIEDALSLNLPSITQDVLARLAPVLDRPGPLAEGVPVSFQYAAGRDWRCDTL